MRAYLIDDQGEGHGVRLAERLSRNGFDCVYKPPPTWGQVEGLVADPPDLFLIDYDLSMVPPGGELANYRGTTLVAELKARLPDRPVVLVTRPQIIEGSIHRGTRRQLLQLLRPSDDIIFKHEIDESLDRVLHILRELVKGFRTLAGYERRTWQELINAVAATGEEAAELREASPPLERGKWVVGSMASWIRGIILEYPGLLYDPLYAATRLGIQVDDFSHEAIEELFAEARGKDAGGRGGYCLLHRIWCKSTVYQAHSIRVSAKQSRPDMTSRLNPQYACGTASRWPMLFATS